LIGDTDRRERRKEESAMKHVIALGSAVVTMTFVVLGASSHLSASEFQVAQVPGVAAPGQPVSPQDAQRPAPNSPNRDPIAPRYEPPPPQVPHPNSSPVGSVRG